MSNLVLQSACHAACDTLHWLLNKGTNEAAEGTEVDPSAMLNWASDVEQQRD